MAYKPKGILVTIKKNKICRKVGATRNHAEQNETDSERQPIFFSQMQRLNLNFMCMCVYTTAIIKDNTINGGIILSSGCVSGEALGNQIYIVLIMKTEIFYL